MLTGESASRVLEQSGTQMVSEESAPSLSEQSGTQMVPEESGGTIDVSTMQEVGPDIDQKRLELEQEPSENEADSVLGTRQVVRITFRAGNSSNTSAEHAVPGRCWAALFFDPEMSFSRPRDWSILFSAAACLFFDLQLFFSPQ